MEAKKLSKVIPGAKCCQKREIPAPMFWGENVVFDDQQRGQCGQSIRSEEKTGEVMRKAERWQGWELEACSAYSVNVSTKAFIPKEIACQNKVLKSRDIALLTKVHIVKAMTFSIIMYRCESCTNKKPGPWRTDAFKLLCWRRLLRVPWTVRRSISQS